MGKESIKKRTQKLFIEPLEQRIMLDGAGASTFLDLIDERNQQQITINSSNKDIYKEGDNSNKDIPFTNIARDKIRNDKKNIVFIDSAVEDYETITNSFKKNTEFYLINANEDGFKRISEILKDRENIDALHLIGHGSSGQILFGNAFLNNDTIDSYQSTLTSIGQSLTTSGDILFYGCNIASTEQGEILIKKISEITKADIAASDDITGKSGDWDLEKKYGIIETENVKVLGYEDDLVQDGISATSGNMSEYTGTNVSKSNSGTDIIIKLEKQDKSVSSSSIVSQHSITSSQGMSGSNSTGKMSINSLRTFNQATGETSGTVNSYLVFHTHNSNKSGTVTFDGEIIGIFWDVSYIHSNLNGSTQTSSSASTVRALYNNDSLSYETNAKPGLVMENNGTNTGSSYTYRYGNSSNITTTNDRVSVTSTGSGTNNKLHMSVNDGGAGDYIRVIVKNINNAPAADNETDSVNEDATITVTDGTTDVLHGDTDEDDDALTVTQIAVTGASTSSVAGSSTYNSNGTSITGTHGTLVIGADGTYTYTADQDAADDLDAGDTATDSFTYTVSDGIATDTATLIITVTGINDAPVAVDDTDSVNEDATVTQTSGNSLLMADDSDADDHDSFTVTQIAVTGGSNSSVAGSSTYNSNFTTVTGTYGTLKVGADGTYTYTADQDAADDLDLNDEITDSFTYTVSDGTATDTATLIITVTGINDVPTAADKTVTTNEDTAHVFSASDFGYTDVDDHDSLVSVKITGLENAGALEYYNGSAWVDVTANQVITATDIAANKLRFNPAANENGSPYTTFDFTVNDGDADSASANTITVNVTAVNDAPVADDETDDVNEDATITVTDGSSDVLSGDTDVDNDDNSLTVTQIAVTGQSASSVAGSSTYNSNGTSKTGTYGTLVIGADGTYTYTADQDAADDLDLNDEITDSFTYTVSDGTATDTATLIITVTGINDVPTAADKTVTTNEDTAHVFTASDFGYTDVDDHDSLVSVKITGLEDKGALQYNNGSAWVDVTANQVITATDIAANKLRFNPAANENGSSYTSFDFTVNDGDADSASANTITVNVTAVNDAPVADDETDDVNEDATITVTDGSSDVLSGDTDVDNDDNSLTVTQIAVTGQSASSVAGSSTYNSNGTSKTGTYGTLVIGADGTYTYTADQDAADDLDLNDEITDSFTYTVSDGTATDTATLIITVTGINDVPTAADKTVTTNEDTAHVFTASDFGYTDVDDHDSLVSVKITGLEDKGALQYNNGSAWVDVTANQVITATDIAANKLRFNPAANENGSSYTSFDFTVNDGDADSASANTITVNVTAVNDAPVADDETDDVNEDATITVTDGSSDVLSGDTDVDNDDNSLTVTQIAVTGQSASSVAGSSTYNSNGTSKTGTYGTLVIGADGTYTYTADQDAADDLDLNDEITDSFTYTVSDGTATDTATLIITVTGINDVPTAADKTVTTNEDTAYVFTASDFGYTDVDDHDSLVSVKITGLEDKGALQYNNGSAWVDVTANQVITATDIGNNKLRFNPAANENGSSYTSFDFTVNDGDADSASANTITVNVTAVNDAPVADDETDDVNEDATITVTDGSSDVLSGDTDVDNDDNSLTVTQIAVTGQSASSVAGSSTYNSNGTSKTGTYGTLVIGADGTYTYTADQDAADDLDLNDEITDSFTYTVSDGTATDTATLIITVTGINDVPTAADKTVTTNEDTAYVFTANDFGYTDVDDHDSLVSVKITGLEDKGALQYNNGSAWVDVTANQVITATDIAANKLRFNPAANENGSSYTSFDFTVNDGDADSASANTITVNVTAVNDAPTARDDTGIVNEDATLTVSNSSDATTSVTAASFVRSKSLGDAGYQSQETKFSPDGTKMFVLDTYQNTNEIHQYTLTTAFDISSASFDGADETFDLSNENSSSSNFTFNNDGTKFYSAYSGRLYEYDVSTAYDISTSSYNNNFFDLILEYPNTRNMGSGVNVAFNSDGTKLFALDAQQREVHEYSLSTAFDVTSASRTNNYVSVGTQEASPYGFAFSNDGKKMFISGLGADVNEYTLSTGFDLSSTFEFVGSFDVSSKDSYPLGITFNNDGTKMFVTGSQQDKLFEYSLTSPFSLIDVSGEHSGDVINTSSTDNYDTDPEGDSLTVTTYSHTSATDQDGGSISSTSSTGTAGTNNVTGYYGTLDLEGNGSYTYTADLTVTQALDAGDVVTDIFTYTVDDGNGGTDTATITITVIGMNDAPVAQNDVGVIVEDGTLRVTNSANANVSGSYDATGEHSGDVIDTSSSSHTDSDADASASLTVSAIRTGSSEGSGTAGSIGSALTGTYGQLTIAADGSYSYVANQDAAVGDSVTESFNYTLSDGTATDIGVITITILGVNDAGFIKEGGTLTVANSAAANSGASTGNHTGDITDNGSNITSITATTAGGNAQTTFSSNSETVIGEYGTLTINSDGSYSYVANSNISGLDAGDANIKDVFTYIVSDGSTTSTATLTMNIIASQDLTARDDNGTVNEDATLEVDDGDNLTTVAPASYDDSDSFTIAGSNLSSATTQSNFKDLLFNPDGTKMYTLGSASSLSGRSLFQYTLSIPFDVSTASVSSDDHITVGGSYTTDNEAMRFNNDGTKLFVLFDSPNQNTSSYMYQYTLSTPYDITSTVTAGNSLRLGNQYKNYRTFLFNDDGSEMFISETGSIYKYTLSTSFDTSTASATSSYLSASVTGMQYNNDGTKLFTVYQTTTIGSTAKIIQWSLSTAYDPTTASSDMSTYFDTGETVIADGRVPTQFITFNNDGSKFFSFNHTNGTVNGGLAKIKEWNLASPFNLTNDVSGEHSGDVINTSSTANYDTDPDSDTLTVTAIRTGSSEGSGTDGSIGSALTGTYGQLTIAANGSYTYVANQDAADALDPGDVVTDTFNYTVSDGQGETDIAVLTITVNGINDTPVADAETGSVDISQTLTVTDGTSDLLHGDTDADASASLSVSSIVATTASGSATAVNPGTAYNSGYTSVTGSKGTLRVGADGTYQYIADSSTGTDVFTYTLSDGTATHTATLTITVNSGNSVPTASNSTVYINENNQASSAGDRTPSNITKIFAASDFNYSDGDSDSLSKIKITTLESAGTLEYSSNGSSWADVTENQEITASDIGNNRLRFTPAANTESNPTFGFKVHDGTEYSSSAYTMTISVNAAPDADDIAGGSVAADAASSGDVHDGVADSDDADSVLVVTGVASGNESSNNSIVTDNTGVGSAVSGTYGSLNIASNGTYTYTASETNNIAYGATATDTFTFTTRDDESNSGSNAYDVGTITFTVASSISLVADTDAVAEDGTVTHLTNSEGTVISNDAADTNGLVVTHIKKDGGSNSTVAGSSTYNNNGTSITGTYGTLVIGADGTYTYTADQDAADDLDLNDEVTDVFVYTADGDTANLTFTVTGINDVPEAADKTVTTNEDTAYVFSTSDFGYTDADDDDALVSVKITGLEDKGALEYYNGTAWVDVTANQVITATDIGNNKLRFNPAANENGSSYTSFDFTVNDGDADSASANTITVNVTAVNDAPVAVADTDTVKLTETVTNTTNGAGTVISDDTDVDTSSSLSVTSITATTASGNAQTTFSSNTETVTGSYGALTINSNGSYSYVAGSSAGTDVFTYIVSDGSLTSSTTLTFTVTLGDPPVAVNDTDVVDEDATVTQSSGNSLLVADDTDADGNTLTVTQIAVTGSSNNAVTANSTYNSGSPETVTGTYGQLTVGADGSYTYVANQSVADDLDLNDEVTDSFTYTVSDGANTDTATLIFTVTGVNDLPTASNNTITTNEDTNHVFSTSEFNFSDVDDSGSLNKIKITSLEDDGALQYYNGTAWVDVTLNQEITATDIANNKLRFKPDANENGSSYTSFAFQVSDGTAYSSSSYTMTVNVTAVNDAPTATNDNGSVNEDSTLTVSTASSGVTQNNDTDPDADDTASTLVVNQITPSGGSASGVSSGTTYSNGTSVTGTYGTLTIGANGTYTYVANQTVADDLDAGDKATDVFTYRVTDTTGATATADITITVTGINDVPTASDKTVSTTEDTPYVFSTSDFGYTDADDDDALVSIKITTLETNGALQYYNGSAWVDVTLNQVITVSDITSGYLRLNPDANENGSPYTTIKFTVNDGDADSATPNTITVNVTAVNDAPSAANDTVSVNEDATTTVSSASNGVVDDNDTDTESDTLVITNIAHTNGSTETVTANTTHSNGQSITGTYGTLTIGANGTYTYLADQDVTDALDASDEVDDVFTYTISDGNGGTDTASITVRVTGVNDTPTSTGGTITTNEDENYILTVNDFNFSDPDDSGSLNKVKITTLETNGNLEYYNETAWVAVTENQEITASDITSGYLRFRPDANENGSSYTTFGYQVSDGTVYSSATTMTVNVTAVNDAPVATDDASSVTEDSIVRVRANGDDLLNDDSDTESDSLSVTLIKPLNGSNTTISSGSSTTITGTYGELTVNSNGSYTYRANQDAADTLDTGENAEEQFVYTVSDGNGGTDTGILTITINGVEDNPNAVKDNVSLNISQSLTLTGNAITNDIDPDDSLTIVGCGQGRNPDNGTAKTVGTAFDSNYGQMTINADGSYTFIAVSNIKDLLDPGQSVTERFYYTISDGNSTSTAMIEVTVQRDNVLQELTKKEQKQIKKQIAKDRLNEPSTIRLPNKTTPAKTIEQTADALESISSAKKLSFNEGIKLVDLVAETGSLTTTEGSLDKVKAKEKDGQLNLKFKVSTDLGNQVVKYEGVMPDGSKLPDWIKVDPQTGKTTTNIPEGVEQVDFTIIAIDQQNNKKEIAVSIDPKEIKADKSIFKQAKKQNASLSVDQSGNVNIVKTNESGDVNQTETKNLNANEKQNTSNNIITQDLNLDNTNDIKNIIDTIKSDQVYQLQTINNGEALEIKVPETLLGNFEKTKLVLKDGSAIPDWVEFDPITGEINANPPEDVNKLEFKLIIERDGEIIVKDLAVDIGSDDNAQILDDIENTKFIAFKDQLNKEHDNWEDYGSNIINRL